MTIFRPERRVTGPDGRDWELYAYKVKAHERRAGDGRPRRILARLAAAVSTAARALTSDEWTIDAVTYQPRETVYTWTTTAEYKGQVLAQVEGHLVRGDIPTHLANGIYRGEDRRSAR